MTDTSTIAKNKVQEAANTVAQAANCAGEGIRNAAGYVVEQAKDAAAYAAKGGATAGTYLDHKAEDATTALGGGMKAAAEAIRHNTPHDGRLGQASTAVAQSLTDTGAYLEREGLEGIASDITALVKKNPIPALLIGIGLGFLVARASTRA